MYRGIEPKKGVRLYVEIYLKGSQNVMQREKGRERREDRRENRKKISEK